MEALLEVGSGGQFSPSVWPHNLATGFRPPSATVVSAELFSHGTGTLRCLQKEMVTYRSDTDLCPCGETQTMSHIVESCPLTKLNGGLSRLHCGWRCCFLADQLWFMTRMRRILHISNLAACFAVWTHLSLPPISPSAELKSQLQCIAYISHMYQQCLSSV